MHLRHDEGSGAPVVLLHGQPGSASDWSSVVTLLRGDGLRILVPDRPGYGGSTAAPSGWSGNAQALLTMLTSEVEEPALVVGWSWAGGVALELARQAPAAVRGLLLVGSVGHRQAVGPADRLLAAPGVRRLWAPAMRRLGRHGVGLLASTSGSVLDPAARAFLTGEAALWAGTRAWETAAAEQVSMVRDAEALSAALPEITAPVTVLHGWHDGYVSSAAALALTEALPHAELIPVDGGHLLPIEAPEVIAAHIRRLAA